MEKIDTKKLFQITEAAHACGLSRSTLMRLEEKGLLKPAYIAPDSGRRYYDNHNVARILQIEKFKAMGFGTEEIAGYFVRGGEAEGLLARAESLGMGGAGEAARAASNVAFEAGATDFIWMPVRFGVDYFSSASRSGSRSSRSSASLSKW